jgi:hypothetical protein
MNLIEESSTFRAAPSKLELGARIGQARAYRWMAKHCSAAGALQLKQIKENRSYESLGLTWEEFCVRHAGVSRAYADKLIRRLDEFGEPYFQLSGIARISTETYRLLAPAVTSEAIEVNGDSIPLTPENAPRIRKALEALRAQLSRAQQPEPDPDITSLQIRLDACFQQMSRLKHDQDPGTRAALRGLIHYSVGKLNSLEQSML